MIDRRKELLQLIESMEAERTALDNQISGLRNVLDRMSNQPTLNDLQQIANGKRAFEKGTHFDKIVKFFLSVENKPKTIREMADFIGESQKSLTNVIYTTHKEQFVSENVAGFKRRLAWSLVRAVYERVLAENPR